MIEREPVVKDHQQIRRALDTYVVGVLWDMAHVLGVPMPDDARKPQVLDHLSRFLGEPAHLQVLAVRLSPAQWSLLRQPDLTTKTTWLLALRDHLLATGLPQDGAVSQIAELLQLGALLPTRASQLGKLSLDGDLRPELVEVTTLPSIQRAALDRPVLPPPPIAASREPAMAVSASFADMQRQVFLVLQSASTSPLRISNQGYPYKNDVARLAQSIASGRLAANAPKQKKAKQPASPVDPKLWFVLALLIDAPFVSTVAATYAPKPEAQAFLTAPLPAQAKQLTQLWLDSVWDDLHRIPTLDISDGGEEPYRFAWDVAEIPESHIPTRERLRTARKTVVETLRSCLTDGQSRGGWQDVAALARAVARSNPEFLVPFGRVVGYYNTYYSPRQEDDAYYLQISRRGQMGREALIRRGHDWMDVEGAFVAQVIAEPLHWLGLGDVAPGDGRPTAFRLTPLGRHVLLDEPYVETTAATGPTLVVQPSFELIVMDASRNLDLVARLDQFAERQSLDRAAIYRLTRQSVVAGLQRGLEGEQIIRELETNARASLPQNVRYSIAEWTRQYERYHLRRRTALLECESAAELERYLGDRQVSPYLVKRLSATTALVDVRQVPALAAALGQLGRYPPITDYAKPVRKSLRFIDAVTLEVPARFDDPYQRFRLGQFAELAVTSGHSHTYRLTAKAARRSGALKVPVDDFVSFIRRYADAAVSTDTLLYLRGWAGEIKSVRTVDVVGFIVPMEAQWSVLLGVPEVAAVAPLIVTPTLALATHEQAQRLRKLLAERGIDSATTALGEVQPSQVNVIARPSSPSVPAPTPPAAPPEPARPAGSVVQLAGSPESIRATLQVAVRHKRPVTLGLFDQKRQPVSIRVQPIQVYKMEGEWYLDAKCFECDDVHVMLIKAIAAALPEGGEY
ncbi:MAG: helicase-associated domain-containing protein [Chloroflexi bacterium]|nr:helicase-associated domain-containing protein [Chloroflexota bacterium]